MKKCILILGCLVLVGMLLSACGYAEEPEINFEVDATTYMRPQYDCPIHYGTTNSLFVWSGDEQRIFCGDCFMEHLERDVPEVNEIPNEEVSE